MRPLNDFYCGEIMQYDKSRNCAAGENPSKSCWEIAHGKMMTTVATLTSAGTAL